MSMYRYDGIVVDKQSRTGVAGLWVEALECGGNDRQVVAASRTGERGDFRLTVSDELLRRLFGGASPTLFFRVRQDDSILATTARTLEWRPRTNGSGVITVDSSSPLTSHALALYSVTGTVADLTTGPLANTTVRIYRRRLANTGMVEDRLVTVVSSANGHYRATYEAPTGPISGREIVVKALESEAEEAAVLASVTLRDPPAHAVADLVVGGVPGKAYPGAPRFAQSLARVSAYVDAADVSVKDLSEDEIAFIARQTRVPSSSVKTLVDSAKLHDAHSTIAQEVFYALVGSGLPADTDALFLHRIPTLTSTVERAISSRLVSPTVLDGPTPLRERLEDVAVSVLRTPVAGQLRLGTLVDDAPEVSEPARTTFLKLALNHTGTTRTFWAAVEEEGSPFAPLERKRLRFAVEAGAITGSYFPVVQILHARVADPADPLTDDPRSLAEYDETDWRAIIDQVPSGTPYPDDTPQGSDTERRNAYAQVLARNVERRFRTPVISARVRKQESSSDLATFFRDNGTFDFQKTRVGRFLLEKRDALDNVEEQDRAAVILRLKGLERLARITDFWSEMDTLSTRGYTSAKSVDDAGREKFVEDVADLVGAEKADAIYDRACWATTSSTAIRVKFDGELEKVHVRATPEKGKGLPPEQLADHPSLVDWTDLFGSPDACACAHCRSVLGPAAYLADVLQLLEGVAAAPAATPANARDVLFQRRPDLPLLALSCDNGETPLPYVDLVNEILEVKVGGAATWPTIPVRIDTSLPTNDLLAQPEIVYPAEHIGAYTALESAVYPLALPFHLWQEEARIYLTHLGVRRTGLLEAFAPVSGADLRDLTIERLGTTGRQLDIIAGPPASPPGPADWAYWGLDQAEWPGALAKARVFLEKSGLSFDGLRELLSTKYCLDNGIAFEEDPPCDLDALTIVGLVETSGGPDLAPVRRMLNRLLRLARVLEWSLTDTDKALTALGALGMPEVSKLGAIRELQRHYEIDPAEILAWYADVDRHGAWSPSLFERVFLDKRVTAPNDAAFQAIFDTETSTSTIGDVRAGLLAALRVSAADLALMTDEAAADGALALAPIVSSSTTASLQTLSRLYRVTSFARANRMKLADSILVRELSGAPVLTGDEGASAAPERTLDYRKLLDRVRSLPLSLEEIHYLVRHVARPSSPLHLDPEKDLGPWHKEIEELIQTAAREARDVEDPEGAQMETLAKQILTDTDALLVRKLAEEPASMVAPTATELITNTLAPFLAGSANPVAAAITKLNTVNPPPDAWPERYAYLASHFQLYRSTRKLVIGWVAQTLGVSDEVAARVLARRVLRWSTKSALDAFVPHEVWDAPQATPDDRSDLLVRLQKVTIFARRFALTAEELDALYPVTTAETPPVPGALPFIDWMSVPIERPAAGAASTTERAAFGQLLRVGDLVSLRNGWSGGTSSLLKIFALAGATVPPSLSDVLDAVSAASGWNRSDIQVISDSVGLLAASFADERSCVRLKDALDVVHRVGAPAVAVAEWTRVEVELPATLDAPGLNALTIARDIRRVARAKHDEPGWAEVARPLRNALREKQRNALVGHLLHTENLRDPNELYERLLIDVEMDPCALTSRLVLAHSSCQLFIQRIQLNLEQDPDLPPSEDLGAQWRWMKNYRVWEANRKVFLWPENWIEPGLRDDKTPLFKDLERNLLSGPIDDGAAQDAYRTYLDGLADLSNLEIVAIHIEKTTNSKIKLTGTKTVVHVFGRTRKNHTYYYRKRERGSWTAWEKVDAMIEGDHLMPFTFGGRLYLAWAIMEEVDRSTADDPPAEGEPTKEEELARIAREIGEANAQGNWQLTLNLTIQYAALKAQGDAPPEDPEPPRFKLLVKLAVSELRRGTWTPPLESDTADLDISLLRNSLSFRTENFPNYVQSTLLLTGRIPLFRFQFYPGTNTHAVGNPNNVLYDPTGGYGSRILPAVREPVVHDAITVPRGANSFFNTLGYQAFKSHGTGSELRLYLVNNGVPNEEASILLAGAGDRIIVDRGNEPARERQFLIMQDQGGSYALTLGNRTYDGIAAVFSSASTASGSLPTGDRVYRFEPFYHPYVNAFRHGIATSGLDGLLRPAQHTDQGYQYEHKPLTQAPNAENIDSSEPYMLAEVDFRHGSSFGVYNWELFFHVPMQIADHLHGEGRYEEAQKWLHYIFDPTDGTPGIGSARYWKFKPFAENLDLADIQEELDNVTMSTYAQEVLQLTTGDFDSAAAKQLTDQIDAWLVDPFDPHLLARMRTVAYQKAIVMRYIDNLIAWGDSLFARDSIESINEATQLYIMALNILGPKPTLLPEPKPHEPRSYAELDALRAFDAFSNAMIGTEVLAPPMPEDSGERCGARKPPPKILWGSPYFCVPPNEKLLGYWDTVADRLFKIRNCMNIEGVVRTLPLFEPPIDPALLVRATAAGVDLATVLFDISVAAPPYRYGVLYGKAVEIASSVASLGASFLSSLEKADGEELANLRQGHEVATQQALLETRRTQLREAQESLRATERSLALAKERFEFYSTREEVNDGEKTALALRVAGQAASFVGQQLHAAAGAAALFPDLSVGVAGMASPVQLTHYGSSNFNKHISGAAKAVEATASALNIAGDIVGTLAGYGRRKDDWDHQAALANLEIVQIERQIEAARIRVAVAQSEVATVQKQIAQSKEVERFLKGKFTNQELYGWMKLELAKVYYQAYKLAYEMAKRAEKAFQFERGDSSRTFITFGYWDGLKKGLLAGERLLHDLRRMDATYLAENKRELELVKLVSLAEHDPDELVELRESGKASFGLIEDDFDRDFDNHVMRRLKSAAVTIPCTVGPYQGVHGTLTLLRGATRRPTAQSGSSVDEMTGIIQRIATSHGQTDGGVFELSFRDERFLPFEGVGAHLKNENVGSPSWMFELNRGNRFSFATIDDLVLELRYTARNGEKRVRETSRTYRRLVRVRREHPDAWRRFIQGNASGIEIPLPGPSWGRGGDETLVEVTDIRTYGWWSGGTSGWNMMLNGPSGVNVPFKTSAATPPDVEEGKSGRWSVELNPQPPPEPPLPWPWNLSSAANVWTLTPDEVNKPYLTDVWMVFDYLVNVDNVAP